MTTTEQQLREALEAIRQECVGKDWNTIIGIYNKARAALALPSQRPDAEGVDEDALNEAILTLRPQIWKDYEEQALAGVFPMAQLSHKVEMWSVQFRPYLLKAIQTYLDTRPYLAKPDAGLADAMLFEIAIAKALTPYIESYELKDCVDDVLAAIARQHTCAGAGKGVVDEEALAKAAYDAVLRIRESEDAPGFDICLKAEMDNRRPIIETYVAALAQWKVSV